MVPSFSVCRLRRCVRVMNSKFVTPHERKCDIFSIRNTHVGAGRSTVAQKTALCSGNLRHIVKARAGKARQGLHCRRACGTVERLHAGRSEQNRGKPVRRESRKSMRNREKAACRKKPRAFSREREGHDGLREYVDAPFVREACGCHGDGNGIRRHAGGVRRLGSRQLFVRFDGRRGGIVRCAQPGHRVHDAKL